MAKVYEWKIIQLKTALLEDGLTDVVKTIFWEYSLSEIFNDELLIVKQDGIYECSDPNPNSYVPYKDLTEKQVIEWVENSLDITEINQLLNYELNKLKNNKLVYLPLPWIQNV